MIDTQRVLAVAADLLGSPEDRVGVDPEYKNAIVQMTTDLLGLSSDYFDKVAAGIDATSALTTLEYLIQDAKRGDN